ncbi:hypothetical protein PRZ48_013917 [Zasmidium cellare]|uniref:IBR domain-containing protein n=1 Tax=Zasmidium cellare TaxID=395010 RepID=A0ABR0E043_ZASCE|nr:hypothetical protein PRZ48_013917 [Zasmidium cellare]
MDTDAIHHLTGEEIKKLDGTCINKVYDEWLEKAAKAALKRNPDYRECPSSTCNYGRLHSKEKDGNIFQCKLCSATYCIVCEVPMHEGMTCQEYRDKNSSTKRKREIEEEEVASAKKRKGTFGGYFEPPPAITYTKRTTALPLKGTHFRRRDPYEIPPDSDEEDTSVRNPGPNRTKLPGPDDPPLSEDELEAVYGRHASPIESASPPARPKKIVKRKTVRKEGPMQRLVPVISRNEARTFSRKSQTTVEPSAKPASPKPPQPRRKPVKKTQRRLPVNELVFVASPPEDLVQYLWSEQRPPTQDPIADSSQHQHSPIDDESDDDRRKVPLTSIRKRLKTPKFTHKSVAALRKKKGTRPRFDIGDGFETSELHIGPHAKTNRSRKSTKSLVQRLGALDLKAGPLPEVKFEDSSSVLKMEQPQEDQEVVEHDTQDIVETTEQEPRPDVTSHDQKIRKVGFSDRVLDEIVMQQLSSISAPRRVYSISSDHSDENQDDFEVTDDDEELGDEISEEDARSLAELDASEDEGDDEAEDDRAAPTPPSNQHARQNSSFWRRVAPTPFGKRKLMEVDDTIYDEPEHASPAQPPTSFANNIVDEEMLDDEPEPQPPPRPRSILRNHTPRHYAVDAHKPEHTAANTRRNSMIMLDDEAESSYFATATDMLQHRPQQPRVLKHRSSQLRRSIYEGVQVLDSDTRILETSPEPPDYSNSTNLDVLKRSSDAVWTSSQSLPRAPRDLKSLTRTVSREHGTVSQSIRRKSSLPFQSPTKVRRG